MIISRAYSQHTHDAIFFLDNAGYHFNVDEWKTVHHQTLTQHYNLQPTHHGLKKQPDWEKG